MCNVHLLPRPPLWFLGFLWPPAYVLISTICKGSCILFTSRYKLGQNLFLYQLIWTRPIFNSSLRECKRFSRVFIFLLALFAFSFHHNSPLFFLLSFWLSFPLSAFTLGLFCSIFTLYFFWPINFRKSIPFPFFGFHLGFPSPFRISYWPTFGIHHSWASASRSMPPASAFRHPVSQSGTGAFRYWTGFPFSGTGLILASEFLFILEPDWLDAGQSDISAFKSAVGGGGERDTQCTSKLQVVESDSPCTFKDSYWWCYSCYMILKNHM